MSGKDLKILLISPLPPPAGGIATWTEQYVGWSNNNGLNVEIVNTAVLGKRSKNINYRMSIIDEVKRTKIILKNVKKKMKDYKPNIVHINTPCGKFGIVRDYLCARISKYQGIKLIIHYRCNIEDQIGNSIIQKYFLKRLAGIADKNIVLNSSSKKYLKMQANTESIVIANFIDEEFILTEPKKIRSEIKIISFVGHIQRTKGFFEIIETAKEFPYVNFKLAGSVSNEILNIKPPFNVTFLGPIGKQEVKQLLNESDVFLFPSYTEGFSNAMLEAMALGLPIIATPVGANVDMIGSSGGIIVEVGESESIVKAINILMDLKIRTAISNRNIQKVKNEYTTDKVMEKIVSVYLA